MKPCLYYSVYYRKKKRKKDAVFQMSPNILNFSLTINCNCQQLANAQIIVNIRLMIKYKTLLKKNYTKYTN